MKVGCLIILCLFFIGEVSARRKKPKARHNTDVVPFASIFDGSSLFNGKFEEYSGSLESFGFVTPWHPFGYNFTSQNMKEFSWISPVLFEIRIEGSDSIATHGEQDINMEWLRAFELPKSKFEQRNYCSSKAPKLVPRVMIQGNLGNEAIEIKIVDYLLNIAHKYGFCGFTFELASQRGMGMSLVQMLKQQKLQIIYVMPAIIPNSPIQSAIAKIAEIVDRILVMTYDYQSYSLPSHIPVVNAPLTWVQTVLTAFGNSDPAILAKILMGIPLYGWKGSEALTANALQDWMFQCQEEFFQINWNNDFQEAIFQCRTTGEKASFATADFIISRQRLAYSMGLAGVSYWELGQSHPSILSRCIGKQFLDTMEPISQDKEL